MSFKLNKKYTGYLIGLLLCMLILIGIFYALDFNKFYLATPNDARLQYIPFLDYARDTLLQTHQYPLWTWDITVGQSFYVDFAYYIMGSFTFYLSLLFAKLSMFDVVSLAFILKIIIVYSGMYFLFTYNHLKPKIALLFSLLTAFSYWYFNFTMLYVTLTDFIIFVPFVLLGIDRLLTQKKIGMYCIALFCCLLANYVAFISVALLSLFYFCYRLALSNGILQTKQKQTFLFIILSILSCCTAAFMLIPVADSILGSARMGNTVISLTQLISIEPTKWFTNLLYLSITSSPLLLLSLSLIAFKDKSKEKKVMLITILFIILIYSLNFFYYGTMLFMYFSVRWLFVPFIILTIIAATLFDEYTEKTTISGKKKLSLLFACILNCLLIFIASRYLGNYSIFMYGFIVLMTLCMYFYHQSRWVHLILLLLLSLNLTLFNRDFLFVQTKTNNGGGIGEKIMNDQYRYDYFEEAVKLIKNKDQSNYRIQDTYFSQYNARNNLSIQYRYKGVQGYISVFNPNYLNWILEYGQVGQKMSLIQIDHLDNRPLLLDSWAVKYSVADFNQRVPEHFKKIGQFNDLVVYENGNYLNWGTVYPHTISEETAANLSFIEKEVLALSQTLIIEEGEDSTLDLSNYYKLINVPNDYNSNDGVSTFHFPIMEPGMIYLYLKTTPSLSPTHFEFSMSDPDFSSSGNLETYSFCNANEKCSTQRQEFLKYLGNTAGIVPFDISSVSKYRLEKNESYQFYWVDSKAYTANNQALQKNQLSDVQMSNTTFQATLNSDIEGTLQLAIPYNSGWKLKINGISTETFKSNYAYLSAKVSKGQSTLELTYEVPYLKVGALVSGGSFLLILIIGFNLKKKQKKH